METTIAFPNLKGRTIGALVCGIFGAIWMFQAAYFGAMATPVWLTLLALLAATFVVWPVTKLLSLRGRANAHWPAPVSKAYWTVVVVEWLACTVAVNLLNNTGHSDLVPQAIGIIVGVHFVPLAKIFSAPIYNWTGAVMTLGALASLSIPAGNVRNLAAYGVCGYALWATAAVILCQDKLSSK